MIAGHLTYLVLDRRPVPRTATTPGVNSPNNVSCKKEPGIFGVAECRYDFSHPQPFSLREKGARI
jgi:hypothetical protein